MLLVICLFLPTLRTSIVTLEVNQRCVNALSGGIATALANGTANDTGIKVVRGNYVV